MDNSSRFRLAAATSAAEPSLKMDGLSRNSPLNTEDFQRGRSEPTTEAAISPLLTRGRWKGRTANIRLRLVPGCTEYQRALKRISTVTFSGLTSRRRTAKE